MRIGRQQLIAMHDNLQKPLLLLGLPAQQTLFHLRLAEDGHVHADEGQA